MGDNEHPERENPERHSTIDEIDQMIYECEGNPKAQRALKKVRLQFEIQMMNRQQWINYWIFRRPNMNLLIALFAVEVGLATATGNPLLWIFAVVIGGGWTMLAIDAVKTAPEE